MLTVHCILTRTLAALALSACLTTVASAAGYKYRDAQGHWVLTNLQPSWTVAPAIVTPPPAVRAAALEGDVPQAQDAPPPADETVTAASPGPAVQRAQSLINKAQTMYSGSRK